MIGKIFVTSSGYDPEKGKHVKDPYLGPNPSLGACRPDIREQLQKGDHVFVVSGKVRGVDQVVLGGFEVAEKISAMEAYERFPEQRLRLLARWSGDRECDRERRWQAARIGPPRQHFRPPDRELPRWHEPDRASDAGRVRRGAARGRWKSCAMCSGIRAIRSARLWAEQQAVGKADPKARVHLEEVKNAACQPRPKVPLRRLSQCELVLAS